MSKQRAKGTYYENRVVDYLRHRGLTTAAREDFSSPLGDIRGLPLVAEVKNCQAITLSAWLEQARKAAVRAEKALFVVFHNRRNHPLANGYFTTTTAHGATLLKAYAYCVENHINLD